MRNQIGLTGGIGSGKSTVARAFLALGYLVYFADDRAKGLYDEDAALKASVKTLVGPEMYDANDKLIRPMLASRIFGDKTLLAAINGLVHPAVAKDYAAWLASIPSTYNKKFVLKEAAILYEAGSYQSCDGVLMVYAPVRLRLQRVMHRDDANEAQIRARMAQQWPDAKKMMRSDFVIYNDGNHPLTPQIAQAIQYFDSL